MRILCLYNNDCALELFEGIRKSGHETYLYSERLTVEMLKEEEKAGRGFDLAVSYTYRYILSGEIIDLLKGNVVNLHNSFLPFNRGADPNLWSLKEKTPRGVTLHFMDSELDKGYIIAQKLVTDGDGDTLKTSYDNLDKNGKALFFEAFKYYEHWQEMKKKPVGKGTYHSLKDGVEMKEKIPSYDMKIEDFLSLCI